MPALKILALLPIAVMALSPLQPAKAIVVNADFGAQGARDYGAGFSSVVRVIMDNRFSCSGAVISFTAIITAQHCTFGFDAPNIVVRFDRNGNGDMTDADDRAIAAASKFEPDNTDVLLDGTDFTILSLGAGLIPSWAAPMDLWAGDPLGEIVTMVGFGRNGVGSINGGGIGVRWAADNVVDAVGEAAGEPPRTTANIISTDFDDGTLAANTLASFGSSALPLAREGTTAGGDSGGPLLVNLNGHYAIAGVLSSGTTDDSRFGDISWWTGVAPFRAKIEEFGGRFITSDSHAVPTPGSLGLVLLGLVALGSARRSHRAGNRLLPGAA